MALFRKFIEVGAKILDKLDDSYIQSIPDYTNFNATRASCEAGIVNCGYDIRTFSINNSETIFEEIVGYEEIKREFVKALNASSPVSILLCGPPGCGKSEFLRHIRNYFEEESVFIDGSYGSKAGIFEKLYKNRPKYVLLDEMDKLSGQDQEVLLNLMESGRLTKTIKAENYDIELKCWVFATANNKEKVLEPLLDRSETYYLTEYTDDEFRAVAVKRLRKEGIYEEELAVYVVDAVLRGLGRRSIRDCIKIARKSKSVQDVDETVQTIRRYCLR